MVRIPHQGRFLHLDGGVLVVISVTWASTLSWQWCNCRWEGQKKKFTIGAAEWVDHWAPLLRRIQ